MLLLLLFLLVEVILDEERKENQKRGVFVPSWEAHLHDNTITRFSSFDREIFTVDALEILFAHVGDGATTRHYEIEVVDLQAS